MRKTLLLLLIGLVYGTFAVKAQSEKDEPSSLYFSDGIVFHAPDSILELHLRFRLQNRMQLNTISASDFRVNDIEAKVSRMRLRFDGFIKTRRFSYLVQLAYSRSDMDWENTKFPNIIRDAMIYYRFSNQFFIGFGQGKLPGNRQGITSSGQQQFAERSLVNSNMGLDRDYGIFIWYVEKLGDVLINFKSAVSTGDGRNIVRTNDGLAYTGRVELLPFGMFTENGDFSEGDLAREKSPKLSLAGGYSYNDRAVRTGGTKGAFLTKSEDIHTVYGDICLKYMGWALTSEWMKRHSNLDYSVSKVFNGYGINNQLSYIFRNNLELAFRGTQLLAKSDSKPISSYTFGLTRYVVKHRTKVQTNLSYLDYPAGYSVKDNWQLIFQVELGI